MIASLREGSGASGESVGVSNLEYDSVKQERDMFREELQQYKMTIENMRMELLVKHLVVLIMKVKTIYSISIFVDDMQ